MSTDTIHESPVAFGGWPFPAYQEDADVDIRGKFAKHRDRLVLYAGCTFFAVLGILFIIVAREFIENPIGQEMARDFGIAFLSASVLGLTIHGWLEVTVIKDVVRAAIGHVLPPELRDEVRWITSFTCIIPPMILAPRTLLSENGRGMGQRYGDGARSLRGACARRTTRRCSCRCRRRCYRLPDG
jgi:hypothetical protein